MNTRTLVLDVMNYNDKSQGKGLPWTELNIVLCHRTDFKQENCMVESNETSQSNHLN